jgi:hypothetical protein
MTCDWEWQSTVYISLIYIYIYTVPYSENWVARMHEGVASGQVGVGHEESLPCRGVLVRPQGDDHSNYNPFPGSLRLLEALPP